MTHNSEHRRNSNLLEGLSFYKWESTVSPDVPLSELNVSLWPTELTIFLKWLLLSQLSKPKSESAVVTMPQSLEGTFWGDPSAVYFLAPDVLHLPHWSCLRVTYSHSQNESRSFEAETPRQLSLAPYSVTLVVCPAQMKWPPKSTATYATWPVFWPSSPTLVMDRGSLIHQHLLPGIGADTMHLFEKA